MSAKATAVAGMAVGMVAATAVATAVATAAVPEAVELEAAVLEAAVPVPAVQEAVVLELAVPVPEAAVLELVVLAAAVRVPEAAVLVAAVPGRPEAVVVLQAVPEVEQPPGPAEAVRVAAQAVPLGPARAMAQRVPVPVEAAVETARLAALARRVRLVPLPALPAWALPQAVAHPMGRPRMGLPQGRTAHRQALGVGHGVTSWRPLLSRSSPALISCVPSTFGATSLRALQTA